MKIWRDGRRTVRLEHLEQEEEAEEDGCSLGCMNGLLVAVVDRKKIQSIRVSDGTASVFVAGLEEEEEGSV